MKLFIVGYGFTGAAVARRARALGWQASATTRSEGRAGAMAATGVTPLVLPPAPAAYGAAVAGAVDGETAVVVTMPPDGASDAVMARAFAGAAAIVYVSSTGVYGDARGAVDEGTPLQATTARAAARIDAEAAWRRVGASVVRAPGIYGPGRGMHLRLARGQLRLAGDGTNVISRVHVDDLAAALVALVDRRERGAVYVMGDLLPCPHAEVVRFLCDALNIPMASHDPRAEVDETLSHDRRVDSSHIRRHLGLTLAYPTYREGFAHCLEADRAALAAALADRGRP